jgi:uncharacterized protein
MRHGVRAMLVIVAIGAVAFVLVCAVLFFTQRSLIYYPQPRSNRFASTLLTLQTETGTVHVSSRPSDGPNAVIYFGGNAEDVSADVPDLIETFPGDAIYALHYPGYGGSSGRPTERGILMDALALYDQVRGQHANIILIGRSLGTGVAVHVASLRPVVELVLVTPFDSLGDAAAANYPFLPVRWLLQDKFESWRYAPKVTAPTRIIVAGDDEVVPRASTERLRTRFKSGVVVSYTVIPRAGHNTISDNPEFWSLVGEPAPM